MKNENRKLLDIWDDGENLNAEGGITSEEASQIISMLSMAIAEDLRSDGVPETIIRVLLSQAVALGLSHPENSSVTLTSVRLPRRGGNGNG